MHRIVVEPNRLNEKRLKPALDVLQAGGLIIFPTDTVYGLACDLHNRKAIDRLRRTKGLADEHQLSFICDGISGASEYAHISDAAFRWIRRLFPGPYTAVLPATKFVSKTLRQKRPEVGVRVVDHSVCQGLLRGLKRPIISTSATLVGDTDPPVDPDQIKERFTRGVDVLIDGGICEPVPSTVIRFTEDDRVEVLREGKGSLALFE